MIRATRILPAKSSPQALADTVVLDFDARHRRRMAMTGERGLEFLLDLPEAVALRDGEGLVLEDGRIVAVRAALEPLVEITAPDTQTLLRLAWHLGNRHLPAQLAGDHILIRRDNVIEGMIVGLGGTAKLISAPFHPEAGAYVGTHAEAHTESLSQPHSHSHHGRDHEHRQADGHHHSHRNG